MAKTLTLQDSNGNRVYPKTIASSVMLNDGKTADTLLNKGIYIDGSGESVDTELDPIDATTLDGHNSDYFAKAENLQSLVNQYNNHITTNTESIQNIQTQITENNNQINTIKSEHSKDMNDIQTQINNLKETIDNLDTGEPGGNNTVYEEKDITDWYKDGSLYTRIEKGKFTDLNIGNYFIVDNLAVDGYTIDTTNGGNKFYIVGLDCFYGLGDVPLTKHHAVIMPASHMFTDNDTNYMNSTSTNSTGYANSYMNQTIMPKIATGLKNVFGNHLITYRDKMSTNNTGSTSWYDVTVRLCEYEEVFNSSNSNFPDYSVIAGTGGLPMFKLNPDFKKCYYGGNFYYWWLSNYYSGNSVRFALVDALNGNGSFSSASYTRSGVRPRFLIG